MKLITEVQINSNEIETLESKNKAEAANKYKEIKTTKQKNLKLNMDKNTVN